PARRTGGAAGRLRRPPPLLDRPAGALSRARRRAAPAASAGQTPLKDLPDICSAAHSAGVSNGVVLESASTLHGQLQRGWGGPRGARRTGGARASTSTTACAGIRGRTASASHGGCTTP